MAVADRRSWLIRGLLVVNAWALLATSEVQPPMYSYERVVSAPSFDLDAGHPSARFVMRVRVTSLGREQRPTTDQVSATLSGNVSLVVPVATSSPFVKVRVTNELAPDQPELALNVLRSLQGEVSLAFSGDCEAPGATVPCEGALVVEFQRSDTAARGGSLHVDWSLVLKASSEKDHEPDAGPFEPPWEVTWEGA